MSFHSLKLLLAGQLMAPVHGRWVYLGQDFSEQTRLEGLLGAAGRISLASRRETAAAALAEGFVEWVSVQGKHAEYSLAWWMSHQAGHNVISSRLFVDLCSLHALAELFPCINCEIIVVCDDWFQLRFVERNMVRRGVRCARSGGWRLQLLRDVLLMTARWAARWLKGVTNVLRLIASAKATRRGRPDDANERGTKACVLVLTCVDESCLGANSEFRDRYFPGLRDWCETNGWSVRTIPWLHNLQRSQREAFSWFRSRPERYLLLEDHMRWWDMLPAAGTVLGGLGLWRQAGLFGDWNLGPLLERERLNDSSAAGRMRYLLYIPAIRRWLAQGGECAVYIQMFENLPDERPALHAFRRFAPKVPTVGYQHIGGISLEALNYRLTAAEWNGGGLPRFIVANSRTTAGQLAGQGFPAAAVRLGPALRYRYLQAEFKTLVAHTRNTLLVLLPLDVQGAAELLETVAQCEEVVRRFGLRTQVKAHPMCLNEALLRATGRSRWPYDWQWVNGAVQDHFADAAIMIGHGSSLLDAAACAIPFLSLRRETGLTMNPLDAWREAFPFCHNAGREDFLAKLIGILSESEEVRCRRVEFARCLRADLGPCDDNHLYAFLPTAPRPT